MGKSQNSLFLFFRHQAEIQNAEGGSLRVKPVPVYGGSKNGQWGAIWGLRARWSAGRTQNVKSDILGSNKCNRKPASNSHLFHNKLAQLLADEGFDQRIETQCVPLLKRPMTA